MVNLKRQGLLDDGLYRMRIDDVEQKPGASGYDFLNVKYVVLVNGKPVGGAIWDIVSLSPQSSFILDTFLDSIGAPNTNEEVPPQWFKGKFVWANLTTEEYKGKLKNEVESYVAASVGEKFIEGMGAVEDPHEDVEFENVPKKQRTSNGRVGKAQAAVAEMEPEDDAFPV